MKILVADDNQDAAMTLADLLDALGHQTYIASNGRLAVDAAAVCCPDVAILDIGMPEMDGYEAAEALRERKLCNCLIACTGWGTEKDRRRSKEAGFIAHIVKPAGLDDIQAALDVCRARAA
jgi:CheY-like chemotaxis protein